MAASGRDAASDRLRLWLRSVCFRTSDLPTVPRGACPTGRTNTRIKGWPGRADQTTTMCGMFVHPAQVADVGGQDDLPCKITQDDNFGTRFRHGNLSLLLL